MNFVFENSKTFENFISCNDINQSGIKRFSPSPVVTSLIRYYNTKESNIPISVSEDPTQFDKYIIASGVNHSPTEWYGPYRTNLFMLLPDQFLRDLQLGKAFLLLDQSHEGYQEDWLYDRIHLDCDFFRVNPNQIIYITGNLDEVNQYNAWIKYKLVSGKICIIPHPHFERLIFEKIHNKQITFEEHLTYKTNNLSKIKTYNCLQKRPRPHRVWMFRELWKSNLLDNNINSMNSFDFDKSYYMNKFMSEYDYNTLSKLLPMFPPAADREMFIDQDCGDYLVKLNEDIMLDTWISVISEASFGEQTCFISEKSFKPLAVMHPFIIYGNKFSLKHLRELGYKTFHPYINESYDKLDAWPRLDAIITELKRLNALSNAEKLQMFKDLEPILKHNQKNLINNSLMSMSRSAVKIQRRFKGEC